jgi:hypothetical protein
MAPALMSPDGAPCLGKARRIPIYQSISLIGRAGRCPTARSMRHMTRSRVRSRIELVSDAIETEAAYSVSSAGTVL